MFNSQRIKECAQITQAAYAYFDTTTYKNDLKFVDRLSATSSNKKPEDFGADFTKKEAEIFSNLYELLHQSDNASPDGFNASLFRDKASGNLILGFRGTEPFGDQLTKDLFITDLRIGVDGYASPQAIGSESLIRIAGRAANQNVWRDFA